MTHNHKKCKLQPEDCGSIWASCFSHLSILGVLPSKFRSVGFVLAQWRAWMRQVPSNSDLIREIFFAVESMATSLFSEPFWPSRRVLVEKPLQMRHWSIFKRPNGAWSSQKREGCREVLSPLHVSWKILRFWNYWEGWKTLNATGRGTHRRHRS